MLKIPKSAIKHKIYLLFTIAFLFFFHSPSVKAQEDVDISKLVKYEIQRDGKTKVINEITITNLSSYNFVKTFTLNIDKYIPLDISAYEEGGLIHKTELITNGSRSTIVVTFSNNVIGIGNKRDFNIEYIFENLANETGQIWELTLPKLENPQDYSNYNAIISIPKSMGELAYISPVEDTHKEDEENNYFVFSKNKLASKSVTAGFGEFQVFNFEINYHIQNSSKNSEVHEIAIPPDTSTQTMLYDSIDPVPEDIYVDLDGNWIAKYRLKKDEKLDIKVTGNVQVFASPRQMNDITEKVFEDNTKASEFWQSDNEKIKSFADRLKTPEDIYNFTKNTLSYNYSRVNPDVKRMGALSALEDPKEAICMEYTDLFIALARAANIPAREVNGYAYTENPDLQPLSLVADVLHSWPEYWDSKKKVWIPIDPTWGSTSKQDYFGSFDLKHFAFVIHGSDPELPYSPGSYKLGSEPQKDIFVRFGKVENNKESDIKINYENKFSNIFKKGEIIFHIQNSGPKAIYQASPKVYFDNKLVSSHSIDDLPPFSNEDVKVEIEKGLLMKNTPDIVTLNINDSTLDVSTNKNVYLLINITIVAILLLVLTFILFRKMIRSKNIKS
ncbi:transglutaminase domain-containing protein [Candidatus Woesebacteria bacterium]|nr:transglutaminase domain-containing protein [Candidatus Woesebacteria bacterium]